MTAPVRSSFDRGLDFIFGVSIASICYSHPIVGAVGAVLGAAISDIDINLKRHSNIEWIRILHPIGALANDPPLRIASMAGIVIMQSLSYTMTASFSTGFLVGCKIRQNMLRIKHWDEIDPKIHKKAC